tara:strand:- start:1199 stop:1885 length:687 start_codon:yes stop_codon:yes gene_type:complete
MDRDTRRIQNTKQASLEYKGKPSLNGMVEGQIAIEKKSNSQLAIYRKKFGRLWKSYMSSDGNQYVDKKLITKDLEFTNSFITYWFFPHGMFDIVDTSQIFIPWVATTEGADLDDMRRGFLTPYKMSLHKLVMRAETINTSRDITVTIEKSDAGDGTEDEVATATYDESVVGALASNTNFELNAKDFNNLPEVDAGKKLGLTIKSVGGATSSAETDWWFTSVWKTYIVL